MTDIGEIVLDYNFLECPVCLEIFDDTCKMLPCQHTFHKRCLQKILSVEERLECPQCRKLVSEDIELLPRNYFLLSVLDKAKPKPSESDQESLQLQFVIEKSKSEAEVKAREEYLLSQKEKLEYELMLLKSEKKGCVDESRSQNSSTSSVFGYTSEGGAKENDCSTTSEGATASLLVGEFGSITICDTSLESPNKNESPFLDTCCAMSLEQQVTDGFRTLNMFDTEPQLVERLLVIVRNIDSGKNFEGIEVMDLIEYDDLIGTYLKLLNDELKKNNFTAANYPTAATPSVDLTKPPPVLTFGGAIPSVDLTKPPPALTFGVPSVSGSVSVASTENAVSSVARPCVYPGAESVVTVEDDEDETSSRSSACALPESNPCLDSDYQSYTFDDDDRNLNYAIELSRQLIANNEPDELMEQALVSSRITCTVDQQKQIFLGIREKVELQIALLMSRI